MFSKKKMAQLRKELEKGGNKALKSAGKQVQSIGKPLAKEIKSMAKQALQEAVFAGSSGLIGRGMYTQGRGMYTTGRGSYDVVNAKQNGLVAGVVSNLGRMKAHNDENGTVSISRSEFVTAINSTGSSAFKCMTFDINAGLSAVFNWLSQIGANYAEWEAVQLSFTYKPVVSAMSVSTVGSLGTLVMAHNPNAGEEAYSSFEQISGAANRVEGNIAEHFECHVECDPLYADVVNKYIRVGAMPAGQDIKSYDHGKLNFALFGVPSAYTVGTQLGLLYVNYTVKLRKPRMWTSLGNGILCDKFHSVSSETNALPFGTTHYKHNNNSVGGSMSITGSSVYTFPDNFEGEVEVVWEATATTSVFLATGDAVAAGNLTLVTGAFDNSTTIIVGNATTTVSTLTRWFSVKPADTPGANKITFNVATATAFIQSTLKVEQGNPRMYLMVANRTLIS